MTTFITTRTSLALGRLQLKQEHQQQQRHFTSRMESSSSLSLSSSSTSSLSSTDSSSDHPSECAPPIREKSDESSSSSFVPPWNNPERLKVFFDAERTRKKKKSVNQSRFRQHVNPLARQFQLPTVLSVDWPRDVFHNNCFQKPLFLDIGCSKGGFLLKLAANHTVMGQLRQHYNIIHNNNKNNNKNDDELVLEESVETYNYLGLEVRPLVAQYAKERIAVHNVTGRVEFLGCNANVDLDRILQRYQQAYYTKNGNDNYSSSTTTTTTTMTTSPPLQRVTIQYPDPHFKGRHAKRRMVNPQLVDTLAKHCSCSNIINNDDDDDAGAIVFLQSDVKEVLDEMRGHFRNCTRNYFQDAVDNLDEYLPNNPLGISTEREDSVLIKDLPVYRALFLRTNVPYQAPPPPPPVESLSSDETTDGEEEESVETDSKQ